jgi:hypothetical protein
MLDRSSTAVDLIHELADPTGWLMGVLTNFVSHHYDAETSVIRIGITGDGTAPNYLIQEPSQRRTLQIGSFQAEYTVCPHRTFSGRNGREMTELDDREWRDDHWSSATMTFDETKVLLAEVWKGQAIH